jgi:hypothetical protein
MTRESICPNEKSLEMMAYRPASLAEDVKTGQQDGDLACQRNERWVWRPAGGHGKRTAGQIIVIVSTAGNACSTLLSDLIHLTVRNPPRSRFQSSLQARQIVRCVGSGKFVRRFTPPVPTDGEPQSFSPISEPTAVGLETWPHEIVMDNDDFRHDSVSAARAFKGMEKR